MLVEKAAKPTFAAKPALAEEKDETDDDSFYSEPRFVAHIDEQAIQALTEHYSRVLPGSEAA